MAALVKVGSFLVVGAIGWLSGFFGSDSIKRLTWAMVAVGIIAALFAAYYFYNKA